LASLIVEKGPDKGASAEIKKGEVLTIGRDASSGLHLTDTLASRHHCRVEWRDGAYYLVDVGSRNGSFLNGRRIRNERLSAGDQILLGETVIAFQLEPAAVDTLIGAELAGYRILQLLGKGGMGRVYKALQVSLDRIVAIKILSRQYSSDEAFIRRFRREAMALAKLNHPNIVAVYDVGESDGRHFFSMEYMQGGSIARRISHGRKLPPDVAIRMMIDIASGLVYAEENGVVHRDIKPENMMLDAFGNAKICDLGIAQTIDDAGWDAGPQGVFGSPHYIAPEQARGEPADHRSDIYSLGASFYRILSGRTMFRGKSARDVILKHLREYPEPLHELEPSLPDDLCRAIETMTEKDPLRRYQSAAEVVHVLEAIRRRMERTTTATGRSHYYRRITRSNRVRLLALVAAVVIVAAAFMFLRTYLRLL